MSGIAAPLLAASLLLSIPSLAQEEARLLRFPHIQGDRIAFVYGGDIWTASSEGGPAKRLTSYDEGYELFPRISPDGEWIAFSGEYSGARQIYLVPFAGGEPRQLTFYPDAGPMPPRGGYDHLPLQWSADGSKLLIKANRTPYGGRIGRYFWVDPFAGGLEVPLEIPEGGPACLSPDGTKIAYSIISREWRTWKRYSAGRAQDLYVYDLAAQEIEQIVDAEGTDNFPMWVGERIYFTSDRTGTLNLYRYDLSSGTTTPITAFEDFDVLFPSHGEGGIIFQRGGWLYVMDTTDESVRRLRLTVTDDRPWRRSSWHTGRPASFCPSPSAKRAVVEYRGEVFDVPAEKGRVRNLTRTTERRERDVSWSPDGLSISYMAEVGDDYELFVRSMEEGTERQLTRETGAWMLEVVWSPDSKSIAYTDKRNRLMVCDVASGEVTQLDHSPEGTLRSLSWASDSHWLTYVKESPNGYNAIWITPVSDGAPTQVTSDHYQDSNPAFDPGGDYLYFVSARDFRFGEMDFESRMFALLLREDVPSPLAPQEDEEEALVVEEEAEEQDAGEEDEDSEEVGADEDTGADEEEGDQEESVEPLRIDLEGLAERLVALPGAPSTYWGLTGVEGGFLFVEDGSLKRYDLDKRESKQVLEGVGGYVTTPDGAKLLYRHRSGICLAPTTPGQKAGSDPLPLEEVKVRTSPATEWVQIYRDAWRIMRDWFYDPEMHGVDWVAMREKFAPLVEHVSHRDDLDFLIGELIGELNAGHTYVTRGESPRVDRVGVGVLGCELEREGERYRITKIYRGRPWNENERSPLAQAGVDAQVGDYLLEIDGHPVQGSDNPYRFLENRVGVEIPLLLGSSPDGGDAREVIVRPIASERTLRYIDWIENNARLVDELSGGRIGYVHAPDTAISGHRELYEGFGPQARAKEAMIIDDRYNGGGWIPARMAALIGSPVLNFWSQRETTVKPTPETGFDGPMVMLINGYSSSGGDAFPFYFRKLGIGPLMGKKTWGGLIGYSGSPRMVDGGGLAVPSFSFINTDGEWDVEAVGVAPDIEVFDDPTLIQAGREPMLEAAVEHLLGQLGPAPAPLRPERPAPVDRSK